VEKGPVVPVVSVVPVVGSACRAAGVEFSFRSDRVAASRDSFGPDRIQGPDTI
jgi:hypothetical protein